MSIASPRPGCTGKEPFDTGAIAREVARRMTKSGKAVEAYGCPACKLWHVGQAKNRITTGSKRELTAPDAVRRTKYGNRLTEVDGIVFHSAKESRRYSQLKLLERAGLVKDLKLQPAFSLKINDVKVCTYKADFQYVDETGAFVVEDVKGFLTEVYQLKKKLMKAIHNIDILET
jgi:hypothetical protein